MSRHPDDRYLWLGFGVFFVAAAYGTRYALTDIVQLTQLEPLKEEAAPTKESPEDSISLATLKTLATSPNPSISASAISLIIDRYDKSPHACQTLCDERKSPDPAIQRQCRTAIDFLVDWPSTPPGLGLCVRALTQPSSPAYSAWLRGETADGEPLPRMPISMPGLSVEDGGLGEDWTPNVDVHSAGIFGWRDVMPREMEVDDGEERTEEERRRRRREAVVVHEGGG
ncbi:hypothetical protein B0A55_00083 [Friedmanniomyces simplex]|uniref:Uncharacterized protein n=1 Tax=Friedmanniomyces simplex TaxID=329884 RepID=A0A4U0Y046_9PEZI|nr:hypothetical protein B0A55_00083 [Friedmanniomyces simplex]